MVQKFKLEDEYIELNKLLKVTGLCGSGGMAKVITNEGRVKVDRGLWNSVKKMQNPKRQTWSFQGNFIELE